MKKTKLNLFGILVAQFLLMNCATFELNQYTGFWDWLIGDPSTCPESRSSKRKTKKTAFDPCELTQKKRHPFYLWFRTPEIIFNPDSFKVYPAYSECGKRMYLCEFHKKTKSQPYCTIPNYCEETFDITMKYFSYSTGIIDYILLTNTNIFINMEEYPEDCHPAFCSGCLGNGMIVYNLQSNLLRLIIFPIHDIIKTALVPIAGGYYTIKAIQGENNDKSESGKKFPVTNHQILTTSIKKEIK
ncbi:MAG: hypothetical protein H7A23_03345 [Leptospiraceae bacterium]|nr:hypothetical protein [Leptospiraceae bacterium]